MTARRLITALLAGAAATVAALLAGFDQPGRWVADRAGQPVSGYDIYIHDRYLILRPAVAWIDFAVSVLATLAIMRLTLAASRKRRPHPVD